MPSRATWPLVGRAEQLELLDSAARVGPVVVGGAAGVGKTRLVAEWAACSDGRRIVRVVATRATATIPFGAFAAWAGVTDATDLPVSAPGRLDALRAIVGRVVEGTPPIVIVDDAHLLDPGSAAVVLHLSLHTEATVVVTVRSGCPMPDPIAALWLDGTGTRLDLAALSEAETATLVAARLGGRLHPAAQQRLWDLSLGNPLCLREATEAAVEQGQLLAEGASWTWTGELAGSRRLDDLVAERLGRLDDADDRRALELVALGEPLDLDVLEDLVGVDRVADLERRGLFSLVPSSSGPKARVVHPLYAEVLRAAIGPLAARRLRGELVRAVVKRGQVSDPLRVAVWSLESDEADLGCEVLVDGANRALQLLDWELALQLAVAAESAGGGTPARRVQAEALASLDRRPELDALLARLAADPDPASRASTAVLRAYLSAWARRDAAEARQVLADAITVAPVAARGVLASTDATFAVHALDLAGAIRRADEVRSTEPSTPSLRLQGLALDGVARAVRGEPEAAIAVIERHLGEIVAITPDDPIPAGYAATGLHHALTQAGRVDEAAAFFAHVLADIDVARERWFRALPAWLLGRLETDRGRLTTAVGLIADGLDLMGDDSPFWFGRPAMAAADLATAAAQHGDARRAAEALEWAERRSDGWMPMTAGHRLIARAWVAAAHGAMTDAGALAVVAADHYDRYGADYLTVRALSVAVRCGGARGVAARLAELAACRPAPYACAMAGLGTALADGDGDGLDAAAEALAAIGIRLVAAEAAVQAASAHRRHGVRQREAAARRRARELLAGCERAATPLLVGFEDGPLVAELTAREREVVLMAIGGRTNREIAAALRISLRTVNSHLNHAYTKLGTSDRHELRRSQVPPPGAGGRG